MREWGVKTIERMKDEEMEMERRLEVMVGLRCLPCLMWRNAHHVET